MKNHRLTITFVAVFAASVFLASPAGADIVTNPGLNPGDQYRLVFVISGGFVGGGGDIGVYNAAASNAATAVAELDALGVGWFAIASTDVIDARDNTGTLPSFAGGDVGVPIFLLNATMVADSYDDFWDGDIDAPINLTELETILNQNVWTGTDINGVAANPLGPGASDLGNSGNSDGTWINQFTAGAGGGPISPIYAISGVITVSGAIPEPGSILFLTAGLGICAISRRRRVK